MKIKNLKQPALSEGEEIDNWKLPWSLTGYRTLDFRLAANAERACLLIYLAAFYLFIDYLSLSLTDTCLPVPLKQNVKKWEKYVKAHHHLLLTTLSVAKRQ
jgi:hypothetical protein